MLISPKNQLKEVLNSVKNEIKRAAVDTKHPFRYVVLNTFNSKVESRYVVLREITDNFDLLIYTDYRSAKVDSIGSDPNVELLFYNSRKKVQVRINGEASVHYQDQLALSQWENVKGKAKKAYTSKLAPGTAISKPQDAFDWNDKDGEHYFAVIKISPATIEVLQLNNAEHLRAVFSNEDKWQGQWIAP